MALYFNADALEFIASTQIQLMFAFWPCLLWLCWTYVLLPRFLFVFRFFRSFCVDHCIIFKWNGNYNRSAEREGKCIFLKKNTIHWAIHYTTHTQLDKNCRNEREVPQCLDRVTGSPKDHTAVFVPAIVPVIRTWHDHLPSSSVWEGKTENLKVLSFDMRNT